MTSTPRPAATGPSRWEPSPAERLRIDRDDSTIYLRADPSRDNRDIAVSLPSARNARRERSSSRHTRRPVVGTGDDRLG
jgi:hypothetical protein